MFPSVAFAESPRSQPQPEPEALHNSKKPIYDDLVTLPSKLPSPPPQPVPSQSREVEAAEQATMITSSRTRTRGPTPTDRLAGQIRVARLWLHGRAVAAEDYLDRGLTRAFALERSLTDTVSSVAPARESGERLMPGAIYVLVAAMAGSVVSRNRHILLRTSAPVLLGVVAAKTFIPVTTKNVGDLVWEWEKKVPAVADAHTSIAHGIDKGVYLTKTHVDLGKTWMEDKINGARDSIEGWVKKGR